VTPDGRYFVVVGQLWRMSNPELASVRRFRELMDARRAIKDAKAAGDQRAEVEARQCR
jgi:hypothetical protein